jgi:CdiI immunity protein
MTMTITMTDYPALSHLLGSYLHQDFGDEFSTAMDAVRAFAANEPADSVRSAADEISILLQDERFRSSPDSVLFALGSYYDPTSEGLSTPDWLRQVQEALRGV